MPDAEDATVPGMDAVERKLLLCGRCAIWRNTTARAARDGDQVQVMRSENVLRM